MSKLTKFDVDSSSQRNSGISGVCVTYTFAGSGLVVPEFVTTTRASDHQLHHAAWPNCLSFRRKRNDSAASISAGIGNLTTNQLLYTELVIV